MSFRREQDVSKRSAASPCPDCAVDHDPLEGGWQTDRFEGEETVLHLMGMRIASEKSRNPWTSTLNRHFARWEEVGAEGRATVQTAGREGGPRERVTIERVTTERVALVGTLAASRQCWPTRPVTAARAL